MVSIVIPTLFPSPQLEKYSRVLSHYSSVSEVIVIVNTKGQDRDENKVKWRFLGKNTGFTGACNAGTRIAKGEFLLFLNDDCKMSKTALNNMVPFLEKNTDIVATQPIVTKVAIDSNSKQVENIGFWVDTKIGKAFPVTRAEITVNSNSKQRIYGLSGTCLLIRKDVFEKVGMFDESFHSYLEDVDLAIRLHKEEYKVAPCLDAEVTHSHMATSSKMGLYKEKQDVKNWWRLIMKHRDVFVHFNNLFPLLQERGRNISGLSKKIVRRMLQ